MNDTCVLLLALRKFKYTVVTLKDNVKLAFCRYKLAIRRPIYAAICKPAVEIRTNFGAAIVRATK